MKLLTSIYPYARWDGYESMAKAVRRVEEVGLYGITFPDHVVVKDNENAAAIGDDWPDPLVLGGFLAARTTSLRFLYYALIVTYRHPINLAKQIATLDAVSGGRTEWGVGTGWLPEEFEILGIPFEHRGERLDEYLTIMEKLWTGETVSHHGEFYSFEDVRCRPVPAQRPHPPILIAGSGPRPRARVLEHGQGWAPMLGDPASLTSDIAGLKEQIAARGRSVEDLSFAFNLQIGEGDADVDRAFEHASTEGQHHSDADIDLAAATIAALRELEDAGITHVQLSFAWKDADEYIRQLEWISSEILPAFDR